MEQEEINKNVYLRSAVNRLFTSILEDPDMTTQFVVQPSEQKEETTPQKPALKVVEEEPPHEVSQKEEPRNISRLQIEIEKNGFSMAAINGEVFFLLVDAFLEGKKSEEQGKLMLTNYRVLFFKDKAKRVDLPFGRIAKVDYNDKQLRIVFTLKYPHSWRFRVAAPSKYSQFRNVGDLYYKTDNIKKLFAFEYALKITPIPQPYHFSITEEYKRLDFNKTHKNIEFVGQEHFNLCPSYPSTIYTASSKQFDLNSVAAHRKNRRLPILAYKYVAHSKEEVPLWISSSYEDLKNFNKNAEKSLLAQLKCDKKMEIFACDSKNAKTTDQSYFDKQIHVNYLKLDTSGELCLAEKQLLEVFLVNKKPFIKQIINSKWYNYVSSLLAACQTLRNQLFQQTVLLIRCQTGFDKSLTLACLVQIIIDPFFRTFKGFEALVMRMFVHNGHPFGDRLGVRGCDSMCPLFLQFLDCVSQLINQNPSSFEFNFKYLAKISSLMQLNIYGTFLANCSKQYKENRIEVETCSIWRDLVSPITTNGFYDRKGGILEVASTLTAMRIWKEHFGDMISRNRDHYGFEQIAEDNEDYLNLYCLRVKEENQHLMSTMKEKMAELERLQRQIREQEGHSK